MLLHLCLRLEEQERPVWQQYVRCSVPAEEITYCI